MPSARQVTQIHKPEGFPGFPNPCLLESDKFPVEDLASVALREGQRTNPLYRVHRWFARRLGTAFRGLLVGAGTGVDEHRGFWKRYFSDFQLKGAVVLDPFVGGGTSVVEASRTGARVAACDIDPVAATITRFELRAAHCSSLDTHLKQIEENVRGTISQLHRTTAPDGAGASVLHHFWVDVNTCPSCDEEIEVHPHFQLARDKRAGIQWVFCKSCHEVQRIRLDRQVLICACGTRTRIRTGTLSQGIVTCPYCRHKEALSARAEREDRPPVWRLFAQEYLLSDSASRWPQRGFKRATEQDRRLYRRAQKKFRELIQHDGTLIPDRLIPEDGRSDRRPLLHGFRRYRELFNDRQLLHLALLVRALRRMPGGLEKDALCLAFSEHLTTNCMMAGYAFDYRRLSPLFSIHAYRHICRPVEINPWLTGIGRGTYPNAVAKIGHGVAHAQNASDPHPKGGRGPKLGPVGLPRRLGRSMRHVIEDGCDGAVVVQSAAELTLLPDTCVDLILTDPPYCDNVSYSELSDFYLAWHQVLGLAPKPYDAVDRRAPFHANLAAHRRSGEPLAQYQLELTAILLECHRILKLNGLLVFTYHHVDHRAWAAVGAALLASGLQPSHVFPLRGEGQGGLHSHDGTIKWDAVFVCRRSRHIGLEGTEGWITRRDMRRALAQAQRWHRRLSASPRLGFREPDLLNFVRACYVARSVHTPNQRALPLREALACSERLVTSLCAPAG